MICCTASALFRGIRDCKKKTYLYLCHEKRSIHCPVKRQRLQQYESNCGSSQQNAHLNTDAERIDNASDGPDSSLVEVYSGEERQNSKAIVKESQEK